MAASLIPERTIDGWVSIVLAGIDPLAQIWAPTPRGQARSEPWDYAVEGFGSPAKLIVLESKALKDDAATRARIPHISLDLDQLVLLAHLEQRIGLPAYYVLPALTTADLGLGAVRGPLLWARQRLFPRQVGTWIRVPSATSLAFTPRVWQAIYKGQASHTLRADFVDQADWPDLIEFIARVRRCEAGLKVTAIHPFPPISRSLLAGKGMRDTIEFARTSIRASNGDRQVFSALATEAPAPSLDRTHHERGSSALDSSLWAVLSI